MHATIIRRLVGWAVAVFHDVERTGPRLASGPVLVTANHPNALVDPLVIFHTAGRATRPLAKAPLFEQAVVGTVLRGLGGLPVYRRQDDPALMHLNERTFDAAIAALRSGEAVQIYPEGQSHSEPAMAPLRTGAARIALMAEEQAGWGLGLRVQPVGLTYTRKHLFRGRAIASYGEPFPVAPWRSAWERDPRRAVAELTEEIRRRLERLTLNFERAEDAAVVDVAERLYAHEKGLTRARGRDRMVERLPRLGRFARGLHRLRDEDPERLARLRRDVSRYMRILGLLGATEGDVPIGYGPGSVIRYTTVHALLLALVLPVAAVGVAYWAVPFLVTRHIVTGLRPELDQVATYKVGVGGMALAAWLAVTAVAIGLTAGWGTAGLAAGVLPACGLAAVAWGERRAVVREDLRIFLRLLRRRGRVTRLAELRAEIVAEIDAVIDRWGSDPAGVGPRDGSA